MRESFDVVIKQPKILSNLSNKEKNQRLLDFIYEAQMLSSESNN